MQICTITLYCNSHLNSKYYSRHIIVSPVQPPHPLLNPAISNAYSFLMTSRAFETAASPAKEYDILSILYSITISLPEIEYCKIARRYILRPRVSPAMPTCASDILRRNIAVFHSQESSPSQLKKSKNAWKSKKSRIRLERREGRMLPKGGAARRARPIRLSDNSSESHRRVATGESVMQHHID